MTDRSSTPHTITIMLNRSYPRSFIIFICIALTAGIPGCGILGEAPRQATDISAPPHQVKVFFATDRAPDADNSAYYGVKRGAMSYVITSYSIHYTKLYDKEISRLRTTRLAANSAALL